MTHVNVPAIAQRVHPVVQIHDGKAITISTEVARVFSKRHDDVLRTIKNLLPDLSGEHARNFAEMSITVDIGNGATRQSPAYHLTRDGFTLLAMGFTGKRALAFKLAYIDAFNKMEATLQSQALPAPESPKALSPAVAKEIAAQASQSILDALQRQNMLVDWAQVIDALTDRNSTITLHELTDLIHAALNRLQRNINAEAYQCIARRAANQGVSTMQVSLNA